MTKRDAPPPPMVCKRGGRLVPATAWDAEALDRHPDGTAFDLKARTKRSAPQNGFYWAGLSAAVRATDAWPTAEHLHADLKRLCGYVDIYHNPLTGRDEVRVQSTAFDKMSAAEFRVFFDMARMRFAQKMGFDPWEVTA